MDEYEFTLAERIFQKVIRSTLYSCADDKTSYCEKFTKTHIKSVGGTEKKKYIYKAK